MFRVLTVRYSTRSLLCSYLCHWLLYRKKPFCERDSLIVLFLCCEAPEQKTSAEELSVYLRLWKPSSLTLGPLREVVLTERTVDCLKNEVCRNLFTKPYFVSCTYVLIYLCPVATSASNDQRVVTRVFLQRSISYTTLLSLLLSVFSLYSRFSSYCISS